MPPPTGERKAPKITDPKPLGIDIDPEAAELFAKFTKDHNPEEVYELWKDPEMTNPTIRQLTVVYFTAPEDYKLPFHRPEYGVDIFYTHEEINGKNTRSINKRLAGRPELLQELAQGFLYWLETIDGVTDEPQSGAYQHFQTAIRELLPLVDEETAEKLLRHYPLKSVEPSQYDHRRYEGYSPLINFLCEKEIPSKYRTRMLKQWFDIAEQEEQGTLEPRTEHERAIKVMASLNLTTTFYRNLDKATVTKIIRFLENNSPPRIPYRRHYEIARIADRIASTNVRFQFAIRHVFGHRARFRIEGEQDLKFITSLWEELQEKGIDEFDSKIEKMVRDYELEKHKKGKKQVAKAAIAEKLREL